MHLTLSPSPASGSLRIYENRRLSVDTLETRKTSIVLPQSGSTSIQRGSSSYQSKEAWFDAAGSIGVLLLQTKSKSKSISMTTEVFYDALESPYVSQVLQDDRSSSDGSFSSVELPIPRCASPVGYCSGFCMPTAEEKPHIVCIECDDWMMIVLTCSRLVEDMPVGLQRLPNVMGNGGTFDDHGQILLSTALTIVYW